MNDKFKDFPLCINCKYFMEEKTGPLQVIRNCGLTMIDPVTGELVPRRHRQAAAYRKENNPCGPAGLFFKPKDGKKTQPKKKEVVREAPKESQAKVIEVESPKLLWDKMTPEAEKKTRDHVTGLAQELLDKAAITKDNPALTEEAPKEPVKRRRSK
jgi:hypothetical protein